MQELWKKLKPALRPEASRSIRSGICASIWFRRLPERIRAHASICFMALILHRVMRSRLKAADAGYTPERALEQLQRIQHHRVRLNGGEPVIGVSTLSTEQNEVLHALGIEKPAAPEQLALL